MIFDRLRIASFFNYYCFNIIVEAVFSKECCIEHLYCKQLLYIHFSFWNGFKELFCFTLCMTSFCSSTILFIFTCLVLSSFDSRYLVAKHLCSEKNHANVEKTVVTFSIEWWAEAGAPWSVTIFDESSTKGSFETTRKQ